MKKRKKKKLLKKEKLKGKKEVNTKIKKEKAEELKHAKYYEVKSVEKLEDNKFKIDSLEYRLIHNYRNAFSVEKLAERYSDILARYDYVVGDWGYEELRLKGFFRSNNQKVFMDQRIDALEDYLYEFCNFGCAFFVLERLGEPKNIYNASPHAHKDKRPFKNNHKNRRSKYQTFTEEYPREWVDKKHKVVIKTREDKLKAHPKKRHSVKDKQSNSKKRNFVIHSR
jgi:uncharacterized protein YutD